MITPRFSLQQDEKNITINIRAPYCSLRDLEVNVDENTFIFLCKPYYLRLHLPGVIVENNYSKSCFDADTGEFQFCYEKANPGEHFKDLEFITKFLAPKLEISSEVDERKIVLLTSETTVDSEGISLELDVINGYGFAMQGHSSFRCISSEFSEVFEIDPLEVSLPDRQKLRRQYEQGKFNVEHYLADFIEDEEIQEIITFTSPWSNLKHDEVSFSDAELDFLKDLLNIEYKLSELQLKFVNNGLLDLLFAYCYDRRTTCFEGTAESGWTIVKLAATFCWLDAFEDPKETIVCGFRRSLIYPLYRNYKLSKTILNDVKQILALGEKYIIKCLIEMYNIFLKGDCCRYILNNLFIKDYITFIMKWDKLKWEETVSKVNDLQVQKEDLGLNLAEIEQGYNLCDKITNLTVKENDSDDETDPSDDDSDDTCVSDSSSGESDTDSSSNSD